MQRKRVRKRLKFIQNLPIAIRNTQAGVVVGNIIDISARLKSNNSSKLENFQGDSAVVDITATRDAMIKEDRRQVKRTILTEFVSVHAVVPGYGVLKVFLYDVTPNGLSFDLEANRGRYNVGDEVELRVYLNHHTFFQINTKVSNVRDIPDDGVVRHGTEFIKDSVNNDALEYFVKFLESVTASLRRDNGDILVSKINS